MHIYLKIAPHDSLDSTLRVLPVEVKIKKSNHPVRPGDHLIYVPGQDDDDAYCSGPSCSFESPRTNGPSPAVDSRCIDLECILAIYYGSSLQNKIFNIAHDS
jgi:hypothetical protein